MKKLIALAAALWAASAVLVIIAILAVMSVIVFWVRMAGMLG
jgi:hypothetical protein